jgi:hypothetical protein
VRRNRQGDIYRNDLQAELELREQTKPALLVGYVELLRQINGNRKSDFCLSYQPCYFVSQIRDI